MSMSVCLHIYLCTSCMPSAFRGQKRLLDLLQLESPVVVSLQMCVLGTELESSARVACALHCRTISLAPSVYIIV